MPAARISRRKTQALSSRGSRVPLLVTAVAVAAAVAFGGWWILRERHFTLETNANRNVLIVTVDTLRADALGSYGGTSPTPNLDRLAARGARFDAAHAHAVVTLPSHASIMSGTYPYEHGVRDNTGYRFSPKLPTIARLLQQNGYKTAHIGKWHLGGGRDIGDAPWPTAYGFDKSFTTFEGLGPRVLVSDEERFLAEQSDKLGQGPRFWEIKTNLTGLYADMTVDFVAQN